MSVNVYRSEQRIDFPGNPGVYFGWYITNGSSAEAVEHFTKRETRDQLVQLVAERFSGRSTYDHERIAALLLSRFCNGDDCMAADLLANDDQFNAVDYLYDDWTEVLDGLDDSQRDNPATEQA